MNVDKAVWALIGGAAVIWVRIIRSEYDDHIDRKIDKAVRAEHSRRGK